MAYSALLLQHINNYLQKCAQHFSLLKRIKKSQKPQEWATIEYY